MLPVILFYCGDPAPNNWWGGMKFMWRLIWVSRSQPYIHIRVSEYNNYYCFIVWHNCVFNFFLCKDVPTAADLVKVSGLHFSSSDLLRMERIILDKLKWNLSVNASTPLYFLQVVSTCVWVTQTWCILILSQKLKEGWKCKLKLTISWTFSCSTMHCVFQKDFLTTAQWANIYNTSLLL